MIMLLLVLLRNGQDAVDESAGGDSTTAAEFLDLRCFVDEGKGLQARCLRAAVTLTRVVSCVQARTCTSSRGLCAAARSSKGAAWSPDVAMSPSAAAA